MGYAEIQRLLTCYTTSQLEIVCQAIIACATVCSIWQLNDRMYNAGVISVLPEQPRFRSKQIPRQLCQPFSDNTIALTKFILKLD